MPSLRTRCGSRSWRNLRTLRAGTLHVNSLVARTSWMARCLSRFIALSRMIAKIPKTPQCPTSIGDLNGARGERLNVLLRFAADATTQNPVSIMAATNTTLFQTSALDVAVHTPGQTWGSSVLRVGSVLSTVQGGRSAETLAGDDALDAHS